MLVIEHVWAREFAAALRNVGIELALDVRIPPEDVEAAELAAKATT